MLMVGTTCSLERKGRTLPSNRGRGELARTERRAGLSGPTDLVSIPVLRDYARVHAQPV